MESNPHLPSKPKRGPVQLKPLVAAIVRQGESLIRRHCGPKTPLLTTLPTTSVPTTPVPITPPPLTPFPFLILPVEIRAQIYHFVFAGRELVLFSSRDKPSKVASVEIDPNHGGGKWRAGWSGMVKRPYPADNQYLEFMQEPGVTGNLLGLALCSRQVYDESIRFLYASTGFTVRYPPLLDQFVATDGKRADYMRWVRVLRLDYSFAVPIVTERFDVRDQVLHVTIYPHGELMGRYYTRAMMLEMLELLNMARADEYRVSVRKPFMNLGKKLAGASFELCEVYEDLYL